MKPMSRWLALAGLLALSGPAAADQQVGLRAGKAYLTPGMAIYRAPDAEDLRGGPAIGLGYRVNRSLGLELLYAKVKVDRGGVVASRQDASGGKGVGLHRHGPTQAPPAQWWDGGRDRAIAQDHPFRRRIPIKTLGESTQSVN